ncbi:MAG: hypothetical protein ACO1OG_12655 [Devosia sp.]
MRATGRYVVASLALGAIATWGSEMLFWSAPREPVGALDTALTLLAYSICAAAALSAVLIMRAQGLAAAFLGGAIMGLLLEGVVVATAYDAFPFQLVWTPLAWHGLITGLALIGLWRWAIAAPRRLAALIAALAAFGTLWALYWPLERTNLPAWPDLAFYLIGLGLFVPCHILLDRLGSLELPPRWVLALAPAIAALVWLVQLALTLDWRRLALLPTLALLVFALRGRRSPGTPLPLLAAHHWTHHLLFLLVPALITLGATLLWPLTGGLPVNTPLALLTSTTSLLATIWLLARALRRPT